VYRPDEGPDELYDLLHDPNELHNLIDAPGAQDTLRHLRTWLRAWMRDTGDTLLPGFLERYGPFAER
jgi:hypothetical protein